MKYPKPCAFLPCVCLLTLCISLLKETEGSYFSNAVEWMTKKVGISGCNYIDCCDKRWTHDDFKGLFNDLKGEVYGQNIVLEVLVPALQAHLLPGSPKNKALVISFHGRPGIGKNYVANFIQKNLFNKYGDTEYVHFFSGRNHFPLDSEAEQYQINLRNWIRGNVSKCEYSMFIFDEVDKIPPKVLDALTSFIDYHIVDGIDFRKAIFILISNTGGEVIAQRYLEFWKNGRKRNDLRLSDFENLVMVGAFNEKDRGLYKSETIEGSLIDYYIPFLPLEQEHIRKCIRDQFKLRKKGHLAAVHTDEIIQDLTFGPDENPIFSNSGCKRIAPKVAAICERSYFRYSRSDL